MNLYRIICKKYLQELDFIIYFLLYVLFSNNFSTFSRVGGSPSILPTYDEATALANNNLSSIFKPAIVDKI